MILNTSTSIGSLKWRRGGLGQGEINLDRPQSLLRFFHIQNGRHLEFLEYHDFTSLVQIEISLYQHFKEKEGLSWPGYKRLMKGLKTGQKNVES